MSYDPTLYAVMIPLQSDGGGEWIDPVIRFYADSKLLAQAWAEAWAQTHNGTATVYRCTPVLDVTRAAEPAIITKEYE